MYLISSHVSSPCSPGPPQAILTHRSNAGATAIVWASRSVDPEGRTLCCGYSDGVVRVLLRCKDGLKLKHALKPHRVRINTLLYSPDARVLATGAEDGSIFFISVAKGYAPIGFVTGGSAVVAMCWAEQSAHITEPLLMVGYRDGRIREITCPLDADVEDTYELQVSSRDFDLTPLLELKKAIKKEMLAEEERAARADAPAPAEEEEGGEGEEAAHVEVEVEVEVEPFGAPLAILCRKKPGDKRGSSFLLSFDSEEGTVWSCEWSTTTPPSISQRHDAPVCLLQPSKSSNYHLSTAQDGSVCVLEREAESFWMGHAHGACSWLGAHLSFDDAFLLSAGTDENFFVHRVPKNNVRDGMLRDITLPSLGEEMGSCVDITDPNTYSIEEAKQKQESDLREAAAEEKKMGVRGKVDKLRSEFAELLRQNEQLPPSERLPRDEFHIDPGLREATAQVLPSVLLPSPPIPRARRLSPPLAFLRSPQLPSTPLRSAPLSSPRLYSTPLPSTPFLSCRPPARLLYFHTFSLPSLALFPSPPPLPSLVYPASLRQVAGPAPISLLHHLGRNPLLYPAFLGRWCEQSVEVVDRS